MAEAASSNWFSQQAPALLRQRNQIQVENFQQLIDSHQQLLFRRNAALSSSSFRDEGSFSSSFGNSQHTINNNNSMTAATSFSNEEKEKFVATIQQLEKEVYEKNTQLGNFAQKQMELMTENQEFSEIRQQLEYQILFFTKRLEEEMVLNEEKSAALKEMEEILSVLRDEKQRLGQMLLKTEQDNESLRKEIRSLQEQLVAKSKLIQQFLFDTSGEDQHVTELTRSSSGIKSQQLAQQMSQLVVDVNDLTSDAQGASVNSSASSNSAADASGAGNAVTAAAMGSVVNCRLVKKVVHCIRAHATEVNSVGFNGSGKIVFTGSSDGTVRAWESSSCRPMGEYRAIGTAHPLLCVKVSEDGELVLGTGCDRKSFVWRVGSGRVFQTLTGHKGKVFAAEFSVLSPNELITGSSDRTLRVWDVQRGRSLQVVPCWSSCNDLSMSVGGANGLFASGHQDGVLRFWDSRSKNTLVRSVPDLHQDQITSVSFSQNGNLLLTNSRDHSLHLIDPRKFESVRKLSHGSYQCGVDWAKASLSPDGRYSMAGSVSGNMFIWNSATGKLEAENSGHQGAVASCVMNPNGQSVASCDKNGFLILWE